MLEYQVVDCSRTTPRKDHQDCSDEEPGHNAHNCDAPIRAHTRDAFHSGSPFVTPLSDEKSLAYWMISSARRSRESGIVRPSAWAVLRLTTNSNFVGCSTGRSPGLAPFR